MKDAEVAETQEGQRYGYTSLTVPQHVCPHAQRQYRRGMLLNYAVFSRGCTHAASAACDRRTREKGHLAADASMLAASFPQISCAMNRLLYGRFQFHAKTIVQGVHCR